MDFFRVVQNRVVGVYGIRTFGLAALIFVASVVLGLVSVYIPHPSMKITIRSLPMMLMGFLFGVYAGIINGAAVDLITFSCGDGFNYSPLFLLQSISIGAIGGLGRFLIGRNVKTLSKLLAAIVGSFSLLYGLLFPSEIPLLLAHALFFYAIWIVNGNKSATMSLAVAFALLVYVSSFGLGVLGAISINNLGSPLLFFRARA